MSDSGQGAGYHSYPGNPRQNPNETPVEPSGTDEPVRYMISTKSKTSFDTFNSFIQTLPDRGNGLPMVYELLEEQSYVTYLTYEQAKVVAKRPFVDRIILVDRKERMVLNMFPGTNTSQQSNHDVPVGNGQFWKRLTSDQHLRILSNPRAPVQSRTDGPWADYTFDPVLGKGQTVYIVDNGFNMDHEEFGGEREASAHVLDYSLTLFDVPDRSYWPAANDHHDSDGHGTGVASVAVGTTVGVASKAHIIFVKFTQTCYNPETDSWVPESLRPCNVLAMREAWAWIVEDVLRKRRQGNEGKSVVCMSIGTLALCDFACCFVLSNLVEGFEHTPGNSLEGLWYLNIELWQALLNCWRHDIITVVAAGNNGMIGGALDLQTPQGLGQEHNPLITVGGVSGHGLLWPGTSFDRGIGGSMTVYSMAQDVRVADHNHTDRRKTSSGTSCAAPAVAGLVSKPIDRRACWTCLKNLDILGACIVKRDTFSLAPLLCS